MVAETGNAERDRWVEHENPAERLGFTQVYNDILCSTVLSPEAKTMYAVLKKFAWQDPDCWPGMDRIARSCNMSERRVRRHRHEFERRVDSKGEVKREAELVPLIETRRRGQRDTNLYTFLDVANVRDQLYPEESLNGQIVRSETDKTSDPDRTNRTDYEDAGYEDAGYEEENGGVGPNGQTVDPGLAPEKQEQGSKNTNGSAPAPGGDHANSAGSLPSSATLPRRTWWQLYQERAEEAGVEISERDPQIIGTSLGRLGKRQDVTDAEMHRVLDNLLSLAASGKKPGSPQQALKRIRKSAARFDDPDPYDGYKKVHRPDRDGIK